MRDPHETCLEIENHLPLWAGGDLEPDAHSSVERHLSRCEACARAAVRARSARVALERGLRDGAERMGVGRDPWPVIRASLRAESLVETTDSAPIARLGPRRWSWAWPAAAAVLVGLFLAGTWLPSGDDTSGGVPTPPLVSVIDPPKSTNPPARDPSVTPPTVAAGLQRPAPGEPRMRDTAWVFRNGATPDAIVPGADRNPREGSAVSLERVQPVQLLPRR